MGAELNLVEFLNFPFSDKCRAQLWRMKYWCNFHVFQPILLKFCMVTYFILRRWLSGCENESDCEIEIKEKVKDMAARRATLLLIGDHYWPLWKMLANIFTVFFNFSKCQWRAVEAFKEVGAKLIRQLVAIYRLEKNHAYNVAVARQSCMLSIIRFILTLSGWTLPCLDTAHTNTWTLPEVQEYF